MHLLSRECKGIKIPTHVQTFNWMDSVVASCQTQTWLQKPPVSQTCDYDGCEEQFNLLCLNLAVTYSSDLMRLGSFNYQGACLKGFRLNTPTVFLLLFIIRAPCFGRLSSILNGSCSQNDGSFPSFRTFTYMWIKEGFQHISPVPVVLSHSCCEHAHMQAQ